MKPSFTSATHAAALAIVILGTVLFSCAVLEASGAEEKEYAVGSDNPCLKISVPEDYEPSGLVWHEGLDLLFVVSDEGSIGAFTHKGEVVDTWDLPQGDVEGLTVDNPVNGSMLYVAQEFPPTLLEFSLVTHSLTGKEVALPHFPASAKSGMEAVTYDYQTGLIYAGSQYDGNVYVYKVDFEKEEAQHVRNITTGWERDCSGLMWVPERGQIFALSDTYDQALIMTPDGKLISSFDVPKDGQEGLAFRISNDGTEEIFVANDNGKKDSEMHRYDYPILPDCF